MDFYYTVSVFIIELKRMSPYKRSYQGQDFHTISLFGIDWQLPLVKINQDTYIASDARLVLGSTEFIQQAATELATMINENKIDYIVTPEAKALPLTQAMAYQLGVDYAVARKSVKDYMIDPLVRSVDSITTGVEQELVFNGPVADDLNSSRVCIVDDVVSTGGTMEAIESLLTDIDAEIISKAAIFQEGRNHADIKTIDTLPLFICE